MSFDLEYSVFKGFTVMQVMKNQLINVVSEESNCTVSRTSEEKLYADCANRQLLSVRRGLGAEIAVMNISSNPFEALKKDDLNEYARLKELTMKDLNIRPVSQEFLMPLRELDVLDISDSNLIDAPRFPPTLTKLFANRIQANRYDFSNLDNLQEVSLIGNNLEKLPNLSRSAPLYTIQLTENNIKELDILDLGKFCLLTHLTLERFQSGEKYVKACCFVRVWVDEYTIESPLKCEKTCEKEKYPLSSEAIDAYNECLKKASTDDTQWHHYALYIVVAIIFIIIIFIIGMKYYWSEDDPDAHPTTQKTAIEKEPDPAEDKDEAVVEEENYEASH